MNRNASRWIGAVIAVIAVIVIIVIAVVIYFSLRGTPQQPNKAPASARTTASAAPAEKHPISQARGTPASASSAPLPALDKSDTSVDKGLTALAGAPLNRLLLSDNIVQRIVATLDALPGHALGTRILPMHTPRGGFQTQQVDGQPVISEKNYQRYAPYMRLLEHTDPKELVNWYVEHYPLFQRAYQLQGYPHGHFNDRLVAVIDDLLATPDIQNPPKLKQPHVLYTYANPKLEALSAGQKMLLRAGPANEAKIKAKLRKIRALVTGATLPAMSGSSAAPASSSMPAGATSG